MSKERGFAFLRRWIELHRGRIALVWMVPILWAAWSAQAVGAKQRRFVLVFVFVRDIVLARFIGGFVEPGTARVERPGARVADVGGRDAGGFGAVACGDQGTAAGTGRTAGGVENAEA